MQQKVQSRLDTVPFRAPWREGAAEGSTAVQVRCHRVHRHEEGASGAARMGVEGLPAVVDTPRHKPEKQQQAGQRTSSRLRKH